MSLPTPCLEPGCRRVARSGSRCEIHTRSRWPVSADYDAAWSRLSRWYRDTHPTCEWPGCSAPSAECDHIVSIREDPSRRLDVSNLRALCLHHHRSHTARQRYARPIAGGAGSQRDRTAEQESNPGLSGSARVPHIGSGA